MKTDTGKIINKPGDSVELYNAFLDTACTAALKAGTRLKELGQQSIKASSYHDNDIKLDADTECENIIIEHIQHKYPDHAILSEEAGLDRDDARYTWIIDPVDGSVNFYFGLPLYGISIALFDRDTPPTQAIPGFSNQFGVPVAAVIFIPAENAMYKALLGWGAWLNERPLESVHYEKLQDCMSILNPSRRDNAMAETMRLYKYLLTYSKKLRTLGSSVYDITAVASGKVGCFIQKNAYIWDIAAGILIASEAGCNIEAKSSEREFEIGVIITAPGLESEIPVIKEFVWSVT